MNTPWSTAIARVDVDDVLVRGYPLSELVGEVSFVDMVFLVHTGELPGPHQSRVLDAVFVTLIEHGISPSTIISRELATCGTPMQAAIAGGVLSIADWHGGSGEDLAETLVVLLERVGDDAADEATDERVEAVAVEYVRARRGAGMRFEGFGHPQHPEGDPRAGTLLRLADECGTAGAATRLLRTLATVITRETGKSLPPNVTGAVAAVLLDLGFSWRAMRGLVIAPRTAGLTAHVVEELEQGARWRHAPADEIEYTGPAVRAPGPKGAGT